MIKKLFFIMLLFLEILSADSSEYKLKAAYIYHIMQFTTWPADSFSSDDSALEIAIYGNDLFNGYFESLTKKKYNKRVIVIKRINSFDEAKNSHILFIQKDEEERIDSILEGMKDRAILTISDMDSFISHGGILGLKTQNNRIKIVINISKANDVGMKFSAKLLEIASLVEIEIEQ